jgi:hypothetical protein
MDRKNITQFLKPSKGRIFLFIVFSLIAWITFQVMPSPGLLWELIFGLHSMVLFLPFFVFLILLDLAGYPGGEGIQLLIANFGMLLTPVYWYLLACTIVVLDKRIRDRKFKRIRK